MACVCDPRTWEVEAGGSVIQRHLQLYRDSRSSLGHKSPSQEEDKKMRRRRKSRSRIKKIFDYQGLVAPASTPSTLEALNEDDLEVRASVDSNIKSLSLVFGFWFLFLFCFFLN